MAKLTDKAIRAASPGKKLSDGEGLILTVTKKGQGFWAWRYQRDGKRRYMGLGGFPEVGLAEARAKAREARALFKNGGDPIDARNAPILETEPIPTFRQVAAQVIEKAQAKTTNKKVAYQWALLLGPDYCAALLDKPVDQVKTVDVAAVLEPVWTAKPETARKLFPRIRTVFERARIILRDKHHKEITNPANWPDLKALNFETPKKLTRGRMPSLPHGEMGAFTQELRARDGVAARLLEFVILTVTRTGTALSADWKDIDMEKAVWSIPPDKLKDGAHRTEPFRIPLSRRALAILDQRQKAQGGEKKKGPVFAHPDGKELSVNAMLVLLKRMNSTSGPWRDPQRNAPITVHGFRATFKTWGTQERKDRDLMECALGHVVGGQVERAYQRDDLTELRRPLMEEWSRHCEPNGGGKVLRFNKSA